MSRQALIFSLRQTQQSCSALPGTVSLEHTTHFKAGRTRSAISERLALSIISGAITGSGFVCVLRFM
jgi:hypothetical protein